MGLILKIFLIITLSSAVILYSILTPREVIPKVQEEYWGPSSLAGIPDNTSIREFRIQIDDDVLVDLKSRLNLELAGNRFAPTLEGIGSEYGFNSNFLTKVLHYWSFSYDWKMRERMLNQYPHFKTVIGGIDIHFQKISSNNNSPYKETLPLLLLHGWPGSIVGYQKIIPLLTDPQGLEYNYEIIIPSLPGFGFSEASARPGMDPVAMSTMFLRLMKRLGHEKFGVMSEDWGALIASDMATLYPENILGSYSTMCINPQPRLIMRLVLASFFPEWLSQPEISDKIFPLSKFISYLLSITGYFHIQSTKPDTLGIVLSQTPSGLAAYILEKFSMSTDSSQLKKEDRGLLEKFTLDELLDNVMIYWVTNSITSSMRSYVEYTNPGKKYWTMNVPITIPTACLMLPEDVITPEFTLQDKHHRLKQFTVAKKGGHFGVFQVPEIVAEDAIKFFNSLKRQKIS